MIMGKRTGEKRVSFGAARRNGLCRRGPALSPKERSRQERRRQPKKRIRKKRPGRISAGRNREPTVTNVESGKEIYKTNQPKVLPPSRY